MVLSMPTLSLSGRTAERKPSFVTSALKVVMPNEALSETLTKHDSRKNDYTELYQT